MKDGEFISKDEVMEIYNQLSLGAKQTISMEEVALMRVGRNKGYSDAEVMQFIERFKRGSISVNLFGDKYRVTVYS